MDKTGKRTAWRRVDGQPLPRGSRLIEGGFEIDSTPHEAAGFYECVVLDNNVEIPILQAEVIVVGE